MQAKTTIGEILEKNFEAGIAKIFQASPFANFVHTMMDEFKSAMGGGSKGGGGGDNILTEALNNMKSPYPPEG